MNHTTHHTEKGIEEIVDAVFKDSNKVICVEAHEETEYLHKENGAYDSLTLDESGNVKITRHPAKFSTSKTMSEGAIDSRVVTAVSKTYRQKDVIEILIAQALQAERDRLREKVLKEIDELAEENPTHGSLLFLRGYFLSCLTPKKP